MHRKKLIRRGTVASAALVLCLGGARPASAEKPLPPLNKLAGVVVSKKDGKPLAGVEVAMAHAEKGNLVFVGGGRLRTFGQDETVLWLFPKRNGRVKVEGKTDANGRFTLEGFTSPGAKYNVGAVHPQYGAALLTDIVPKDYAGRELRIELDEPSFVRTEIPSFDTAYSDTAWEYVSLELAPEALPAAATQPSATGAPPSAAAAGGPAAKPASEETEPQAPQVMFDLEREPGGSDREAGMARWGPLPVGRKYIVSRVRYLRTQLWTATLFARPVTVAPGQTVKVDLTPHGEVAMSGKISGADGQPLAGVNVKLHVGDDVVIGAVTDKQGEYALRDLPAGKYVLELYRRAAPSGFG